MIERPNTPLQTDDRRVLVVAKLDVTFAPLAAERQAVWRTTARKLGDALEATQEP